MKIYTALSYSVASDIRYYGEVIDRYLSSYWAIMQQPNPAMKAIYGYKKKFFLDSGAFSATSKGVNIPIKDYADFIKEHQSVIDVYSNLDVIGDYKGTQKNQEILEGLGLNPIPVFHYMSPEHELVRLCRDYDYIALGGLVPLATRRTKLRSWLDYCFSIIIKENKRNNKQLKVHGFGMTSRWAQERYPFYSCDSTSAFEGSIRGTISLDGQKLDPRTSLIAFGVMDKGGQKLYKERVRLMIADNVLRQKQLTKLWEKRGIIWED